MIACWWLIARWNLLTMTKVNTRSLAFFLFFRLYFCTCSYCDPSCWELWPTWDSHARTQRTHYVGVELLNSERQGHTHRAYTPGDGTMTPRRACCTCPQPGKINPVLGGGENGTWQTEVVFKCTHTCTQTHILATSACQGDSVWADKMWWVSVRSVTSILSVQIQLRKRWRMKYSSRH